MAFIIPAAVYYQKHRTFKGALKSLIIGLVCQLLVSLVANVYVMFPFYMQMFGISEEALLGICQAANPAVKDIRWSVGFMAVLPFNAMKDAIIIVVTMLVYKSTHTLFDKIQK